MAFPWRWWPGSGRDGHAGFDISFHAQGAGAILVADVGTEEDSWNHDDESQVSSSGELLVCGVGASGVPSCKSFDIAESNDYDGQNLDLERS